MNNIYLSALSTKASSAIKVLVVAESQHQRLAFSDTVRSCDFALIDCVSRQQLRDKPQPYKVQVDIWLIDSEYDDDIATVIKASNSSAVLVGFSQAPHLNEIQRYAKWQRKLKRKLAQLLDKPTLLENRVYDSTLSSWRFVVFLGSAMGGSSAVKAFLDNLSPTLPICVLLAQHFNPDKIETLPRILNRHNEWCCQVISTTQKLRSGYCLIAPIDKQIVCDSEGRVILTEQEWSGEYRPSIGQLLKNTSDVYGSELVSIIFSGMGDDGTQHLDNIQENNSQLWAQDPDLSTYSNQPQAIVDSGYCQFIGDPAVLAQKLTEYIGERMATLSSSTVSEL